MTHTHLTEVRSRATWGALRVARRGSSRTTTTVGHCRARCALGAPKAKRDDKDEVETTKTRWKRLQSALYAWQDESEVEQRRTRAERSQHGGTSEYYDVIASGTLILKL